MTNIVSALAWKHNGLQGISQKNNILFEFPPDIPGVDYDSNGLPTNGYQTICIAEYETHLFAIAYIEKRKKAYLPLQDQLDMIYWDEVNRTGKWMAHIAKVKSDHPNPASL